MADDSCICSQYGGSGAASEDEAKEPNLHTRCFTDVRSISSLQFHIKILYAVVICLIVALMSSLTICYLEISSLKEVLSCQLTSKDIGKSSFYERKVSNSHLEMPYIHPGRQFVPGELSNTGELTTGSADKNRAKRRAGVEADPGSSDDLSWVSSLTRESVSSWWNNSTCSYEFSVAYRKIILIVSDVISSHIKSENGNVIYIYTTGQKLRPGH